MTGSSKDGVQSIERLLYSVKEATALLGIQRTTLNKLFNEGELERVKIGRRTLVPAASVAAYVTRLETRARDAER